MIDENKLSKDICHYLFERLANTSIFELSRKRIEQVNKMRNDIIDIINEQPKTDWIPCEERLPNNAGMYLATYVYENMKIVEIMFFDGKNYYYPDDMLGISKKFIEVIAWQPLPAPYKKEGNSNENT